MSMDEDLRLPRTICRSCSALTILVCVAMLLPLTTAAPMLLGPDTETDGGCHYMLQHYDDGEIVPTNEPCLNCTCQNSKLLCFLQVCPFYKPIGYNCTVHRIEGQCCPTVTCPQIPVPVGVVDTWPAPTTVTTTTTTEATTTTLSTETLPSGCYIDGKFYADGARVPGDPSDPCQLCYCVRNQTACLLQQCTLQVPGCSPVFRDGVCCPVRYNCHSRDVSTTTTSAPRVGCVRGSQFYADGASVPGENPCENCYCVDGNVICASPQCARPPDYLEGSCKELTKEPGQCCPVFECPRQRIASSALRLESKDSGTEEETTTEQGDSTEVATTPSPQTGQSCIRGETMYEDGASVPGTDACEFCRCMNGEIVCAQPLCDRPPSHLERSCKELPKQPGCCCPEFDCSELKDSPASAVGEEILMKEKDRIQNRDLFLNDPAEEDPGDQQTETAVLADSLFSESSGFGEIVPGLSSEVPENSGNSVEQSVPVEKELVGIVLKGPITLERDSTTPQNPSGSTEEGQSTESSSGDVPDEENQISSVPGSCLVDGVTYEDQAEVPGEDPCQIHCACRSGIITCKVLDCPPPPADFINCKPYSRPGKCCPGYACDGLHGLVPAQVLAQGSSAIDPVESPFKDPEEVLTKSSEKLNDLESDREGSLVNSNDPEILEVQPSKDSVENALPDPLEDVKDLENDPAGSLENPIVPASLEVTPSKGSVENGSSDPSKDLEDPENDPEGSLANLKASESLEVEPSKDTVDDVWSNPSEKMKDPENDPSGSLANSNVPVSLEMHAIEDTMGNVLHDQSKGVKDSENDPERSTMNPDVPASMEVQPNTDSAEEVLPELTKDVKDSGNDSEGSFVNSNVPVSFEVHPSKDSVEDVLSDSSEKMKEPEPENDPEGSLVNSNVRASLEVQSSKGSMEDVLPDPSEKMKDPENDSAGSLVTSDDSQFQLQSSEIINPESLEPQQELSDLVENTTEDQTTVVKYPEDLTQDEDLSEIPEHVTIQQDSINLNEDSTEVPESLSSVQDSSAGSQDLMRNQDFSLDVPESTEIPQDSTEAPSDSIETNEGFQTDPEGYLENQNFSVGSEISDKLQNDSEMILEDFTAETVEKDPENGAEHVNSGSEDFSNDPEKPSVETDDLKVAEEIIINNQSPGMILEGSLTNPKISHPSLNMESLHRIGESHSNEDLTKDPETIDSHADLETGSSILSSQDQFPSHSILGNPSRSSIASLTSDREFDAGSSCFFEGRIYVSAQQVLRSDPCEFCFCFRGDVICLQQSCPSPLGGCHQETIPGFCCPRYRCPVTREARNTSLPQISGSSGSTELGDYRISGCKINDKVYDVGILVDETSGPCLVCRCNPEGSMDCDPRQCQPEPLLRKVIAFAGFRRRRRSAPDGTLWFN